MVIIAESDKSKTIRGIILADCTTIEIELSRFLSDYFGENENKKRELFNLIFNTELFTLSKKIELFKKVVDTDFYSQRDELIEALEWLRKVRNSLAHGTWDQQESQKGVSILKNPKNDEPLKVDDDLLKEHEKRFGKILLFFDAYYS